MKENTKKVFIKNFGCQMNVRDSEVICGLLKNAGYKITDSADKADIILFNTCSVRQHAEDKVWSEIGRIAKRRIAGYPAIRVSGMKPFIGVIGCMAQNYKEKIFERSPDVNFVVGPGDIHKIPGILHKLSTIDHRPSTRSFFERKIWETESEARPGEIYHTGFYENKRHAYVVISEGCSNFCSYCIVPYVRGALHNRDYRDIVKEIEGAVDQGIASITLLGQNVNAYRSPGHQVTGSPVGFVELLRLINCIKGLKEFSFVTSHPKDTSSELFRAMAELEKLKKYLHLPVQSGSDKILKLMNRGYTRKFYLELVENFRTMVKGCVLTTDIIVGFPTETEEDFRDTYSLMKEAEFSAAFIFKYSPRPHTEAAKFVDDVERAEKERRHALILELQKRISHKLKGKTKKLKRE